MHRTAAALAILATASAALAAVPARAQQVADSAFAPPIASPAYAQGRGPVVLIDEGHQNFHTAGGRYYAFAQLLRRDGFVVRGHPGTFTAASLRPARVLVIANALHPRNAGGDWTLPTPSAFTAAEIAAVREWVRGGGSLLLIADHMPMAGAAEQLGAAFGVEFANGFARDTTLSDGSITFRVADGSLGRHAITAGRGAGDGVDSVVSFTGSAFHVAGPADTLMRLPAATQVLLPDTAWQFSARTRRFAGPGWLQGVALRHGSGRVAIFGEAAMFSAQLAGPNRQPMGMSHPSAPQNPRFVLNTLHWLVGLLPER
jgi:hypothetical protein